MGAGDLVRRPLKMLLLTVVLATLSCSDSEPSTSVRDPGYLYRTGEIPFLPSAVYSVKLSYRSESVTVEDQASVQTLARLVRFTPKPPCKCNHPRIVTFQSPKGDLEASYCNHCFDVHTGTGPEYYEMPPALWVELESRRPDPPRR